MRSYVVAVLLGSLVATPAFADDKLENPSAPTDAPVAAPSAPAPSAAPSAPAPSATAPKPAAGTPGPSTPSPAPIAKAEAKVDPLVDLPKQCAPIAKRMATPNRMQAMSARIALASCIADARLAPLTLLDTQESMLEIEAAIAPSFELLDDVIARGDVQNQLLAHHKKVVLLQQAATRMFATVPPAAQPTVEAAQLRDSRRALVEAMTEPWRTQIDTEARVVVAIAKANPKLEKNPMVAIALRETRKIVPEPVATR